MGYYNNPILKQEARDNLTALIRNADKLGCSVIGAFAGGNPEKSVPETIPEFAFFFTLLKMYFTKFKL